MSYVMDWKNEAASAPKQETLKLAVAKIDPRELAITAVGKFYNKA